jgi:hypothetical protein
VFVHALSGAASFAACLRLFRSYPLALNASCPGDPGPASARHAAGGRGSIVLRHRGFDDPGFYVLAQHPAEHFTLRPWHAGDGACRVGDGAGRAGNDCHEIRPGTPVPVVSHRIITEGMPVPRDGALLGWVSDRQVTALLTVHHERRDACGAGPAARTRVPEVRVLAMVGSEPMRWPPFAASPLDDGRLWEYLERGELVDLASALQRADGAYWVPSQHPDRARRGHGCAVLGRSIEGFEFWVPAGVYMDHWMLREGVPTPPASHLVTLPGTTRLSRHPVGAALA